MFTNSENCPCKCVRVFTVLLHFTRLTLLWWHWRNKSRRIRTHQAIVSSDPESRAMAASGFSRGAAAFSYFCLHYCYPLFSRHWCADGTSAIFLNGHHYYYIGILQSHLRIYYVHLFFLSRSATECFSEHTHREWKIWKRNDKNDCWCYLRFHGWLCFVVMFKLFFVGCKATGHLHVHHCNGEVFPSITYSCADAKRSVRSSYGQILLAYSAENV